MPTRRSRIYGFHRRTPGADAGGMPHVAQQGAVTTQAARRHLRNLSPHDRARPASGGGGIAFLLLLIVVGVIVAMALGATGNL